MKPYLLVAIADEWRDLVCRIVEKDGFEVLIADSPDDALRTTESRQLTGILVSGDWAIATVRGEPAGLMKAVRGKIPTITFITPTTHFDSSGSRISEVYDPPLHEYVSVPVSVEEIIAALRRAGMSKSSSRTKLPEAR